MAVNDRFTKNTNHLLLILSLTKGALPSNLGHTSMENLSFAVKSS